LVAQIGDVLGKARQNYPLQPTSAMFMEAITFEPLPALCAG
jgi:hypothetical protein